MRIFAVTLGFAPSSVLGSCLKQVYSTIGIPVEHHLLNNHFPIDKHKNNEEVKELCEYYNIKYHDENKNLGLQAGYNYLIDGLSPLDTDVIIAIDPDTYPVTKNWGKALVEVASHPSVAWGSLMNPPAEREIIERGYKDIIINGIATKECRSPCVNSICAWPGSFLKAVGGLKEPNKFYGGIECMMWPMVKKLSKKWVYLSDYKEEAHESVQSHPLYKQYKWEYAHAHTTKDDFETWLHIRSSR